MPPKIKSLVSDTERAKKFSNEELSALIDTLSPIYGKLFGVLNKEVTHDIKQTLWAKITDAVNCFKLVIFENTIQIDL